MSKNGDVFTPTKMLPRYESEVFARSINFRNSCQRPTLDEAVIKLASSLGAINIYHPFPEGNGRTQRVFIYLLAKVFQYSINWDATHAWEIVETSKQVHIGNYKPLEKLIRRIILDGSNA